MEMRTTFYLDVPPLAACGTFSCNGLVSLLLLQLQDEIIFFSLEIMLDYRDLLICS